MSPKVKKITYVYTPIKLRLFRLFAFTMWQISSVRLKRMAKLSSDWIKYEMEMDKKAMPKSMSCLCSDSLYSLKAYLLTMRVISANTASKIILYPRNQVGIIMKFAIV